MARYQNNRKYLLILSAVLAVGLLAHSIIFFATNKAFDLAKIALQPEFAQHRLTWRNIAEVSFSICGTIYTLGHLWILFVETRKKSFPSQHNIIMHFIVQLLLVVACTLPFGLFDQIFLGDYLFPIWNTLIMLVIITVVKLFLSLDFSKKHL